MMKLLILMSFLILSFKSIACTDVEADALVLNRATIMAKRYASAKLGIGVSMLWGNTRITNITILDGTGSDDGSKRDRIGAIYINMDNCVVEAKLIGIYDIINVQ